MGLKIDISKAFKKTAGLSVSEPNKNIDNLAGDLEKAIEKFLLIQEFRVVKLESKMDVNEIKTSNDLDVNVKPETLMGPYAPLISSLKKLASLIPGAGDLINKVQGLIKTAAKGVSEGGSTLPSLDLKKNEGLTVNGTSGVSTSNYKTSKKSSGLAAKSAVILYSGEVKGKG